MKIVSIEPTPSPHSMKLTMDESLPAGVRKTYTPADKTESPEYIRRMLEVDGVKHIFHTADFIALERDPKAQWQPILAKARELLGESSPAEGQQENSETDSDKIKQGDSAPASKADGKPPAEGAAGGSAFGEAKVLVQMFRGIPMQIRVQAEGEEARLSLPQRFVDTAFKAQGASTNLITERKLVEYGVRYGNLQEIAGQIVEEFDASYSDERLASLVAQAFEEKPDAPDAEIPFDDKVDAADIDTKTILFDPEWKKRYAAFSKLVPSKETLPVIVKALKDKNFSIRRLAVVYLGDINDPVVYPYLYRVLLEDKNPSVRRTAGDCLSDIGDPDATAAMCRALKDPHKIVRWRAARFLYEQGDETAVEALKEAENDSEFEVSMQAQIALQRIAGGEAAAGSVWQQMTRRNEDS